MIRDSHSIITCQLAPKLSSSMVLHRVDSHMKIVLIPCKTSKSVILVKYQTFTDIIEIAWTFDSLLLQDYYIN